MNTRIGTSLCSVLVLACSQPVMAVVYDNRYTPSNGSLPSASAWQNAAHSGDPVIAVVGTGDAAFLQLIDDNSPEERENISYYSTRGIDANENWWFETNLRVLSADVGFFSVESSIIDQGAGNHGFVQMWFYPGADGVAGGAGADQDQIFVTTLDDPSPTTAAQNLITVDTDFTLFRRVALQRNVAAGEIQLFIDGQNVGSRALADFSDYPPPAYNDNANYQSMPGSGSARKASWEVRRHDISLGEGVRTSWNVAGGGSWSSAGNWFDAVPDAVNAVVDFGRAISAAAVVDLDSARTVGAIAFDSPFGYTLSGTGTLTLDATTNHTPQSKIDNYTGHNTISAPVSLNSTTELWVVGGSTLTISSQMTVIAPLGARVTKFGDGMLELKNVRATEIEVNNGTVRILPDGTTDGLSGVELIAIGGATDAWTGQLDLENNSFIVEYSAPDPSPLPTIANYIKNGYAGGAWNGNGMMSSSAAANPQMALGYGEAGVIYPSGGTFMTVPVDSDMVLVMYTFEGDSNLDGKVNTLDFNNLAGGFGAVGTGDWVQGDFNYDGDIDSLDFTALVANYGSSLPGAAALGSVVPEPAGVSVLAIALGAAFSSRRRRSGNANPSARE